MTSRKTHRPEQTQQTNPGMLEAAQHQGAMERKAPAAASTYSAANKNVSEQHNCKEPSIYRASFVNEQNDQHSTKELGICRPVLFQDLQ